MSAIAALRSATWSSHQRLERRLDVKTRFGDVGAYRSHLERMWGFCAVIEQSLQDGAFGGALTDYELRRKLPLLTKDLLVLGADEAAIASLPRCQSVGMQADLAAAFGCVYVLEGATLGGRTLLPMVQARLGLTPDRGAAYLASYGDRVAPMWRDFGAALDAWCCFPERRTGASEAAVRTFDALAEWLCGEPH